MNASSDSPDASVLISWLAMLARGSSPQSLDDMPDEMRQVQSAFKSLVNSLPLNLLIKDTAGRRVFANRKYLETLHMTLDEILGKTDFELFPEDLARKFSADDAEVLRTGQAVHDNELHRTRGDSPRWIERSKGPLRDADGKIVGLQVLFWDVTDRKQAQLALEHERSLLHALMDNIPDSIPISRIATAASYGSVVPKRTSSASPVRRKLSANQTPTYLRRSMPKRRWPMNARS